MVMPGSFPVLQVTTALLQYTFQINSGGTVGKFNLCTILFKRNMLCKLDTGWNNFVSFLLTDHAWSKCLLLFSLKIIILNAVHKYFIEHMNLTVITIKLYTK